MKKLARFLSIALLLVTGFLGLYNGSTELGEALTGLQRSVTLLAGVAGAFVSIAVIGAFVIWTARSATRVPQPTERSHIPPS